MKIEKHPDISAIKQLARSLHKQGTAGGAAAFVGAGMSRSAHTLNNMPPPPLWDDLRREMLGELYDNDKNSAHTTSAIQLAEEFRATLGDAALVDFLKRHITDDIWEPTQIHADLLELPWSDIMTTNYDTLLERSVRDSGRRYEPVLNEGDLAHASSPRIIKLHGTAQNMHDVIFSEEDYRVYPEKHPAFLNTVRQIFIENELCLIGFSGEDPNFLSWAGWVRDILKFGARRIFLVGILNLSQSKRKLFERQNIIPIDLGYLFVSGEDPNHQKAYKIFFDYLRSLEPQAPDEWLLTSSREYWPQNFDERTRLSKDGEFAKPVLLEALKNWKADRKAFPGWLITPFKERLELFHNSEIDSFTEVMISALSNTERKSLLSELAWRQHKMLRPLSDFILQQIVELVDRPEGFGIFPQEIREEVFQVVLQSLYENSGREKFLEFAKTFYDREVDPNLLAFIRYYQCIDAYRRLDFDYVAEHVDKISEQNSDPIWLVRKAGLLLGIGNSDQANRSLYNAISELKRLQYNDPDSMWVQSRLSWAMWIGSGLRWRNPEFNDQKNLMRKITHLQGCNPSSLLDRFSDEFKDVLGKHANNKELIPKFDVGKFEDNSQIISFGIPSWSSYHFGFFCTLALTGVPFRADFVDYTATKAQQALELKKEQSMEWYLNLLGTHPVYNSELINVHFSRIAIAQLDSKLVDEIVPRVKNNIEFWRKKIRGEDKEFNDFAVNRLRTLIEVLSRLSIRMNSEKAILFFEFGCTLAKDNSLRHWWLYGPLTNLLKNTFSSVIPDQRKNLALLLLDFPFSSEVSDPTERNWPDIASIGYIDFEYTGSKTYLRNKVESFLQKLSDDNSRAEAALRLTYLFEAKLLTKGEQKKFGEALWEDVEKQKNILPKGTNFYPHIFSWLPCPDNVEVSERVYKTLYKAGDKKLEGFCSITNAILLAARDERTKVLPTVDKAKRMFEVITKRRPKKDKSEDNTFDFGRSVKRQSDRSVGSVLSDVVIEQLEKTEINIENAQKVLTLIDETKLTSALPALIVFLGVSDEIEDEIIKYTRLALTSQDHVEIYYGVQTIKKWLENNQNRKTEKIIPRNIISGVLKALFRAPNLGLSTLIECAQLLTQYDQFTVDDIDELVELLEDLLVILDYFKIEPSDPKGIGAPMARLQCMVLSKILLNKGHKFSVLNEWITSQSNDPLPEIRLANLDEMVRELVK